VPARVPFAMPVGIDTSAALASRYDEIPYDALPHPTTHPGRLATVATYVGHVAPGVERCRVLEVGCNDGSNLIPMAVSLPAARFVGCDLSPRALDAGRRMVAELGRNTEFVRCDVENDEEVTVAFAGKGVKRLLASFAKLEKAE